MAVVQPIFVVSSSGELVRMQPSAPPDEKSLQELIARHPDIIGDSDGSLLLIQREQSILDTEGGSPRWSLDHLFVTRGAVPVLVEVKRASDTRIRREVVGQMMDYAANGVAYWPTGTVHQIFEQTCREQDRDPLETLTGFLGGEQEIDEFWSQVDANFRSGHIKLVFVADEIPRELARIVEFLNEQMTADVRAVELRYFEGAGGFRTLAPRIIGETERAQAQKASSRTALEPITTEDWIEQHIAPKGKETLDGLRAAVSMFEQLGAPVTVSSAQGSLIPGVESRSGRTRYPFLMQRNGTLAVHFYWLRFMPDQQRIDFLHRFAEAVGGLSTENINGFPSFPFARLTDPVVLRRFRDVAADLLQACRES